VDTHLNTVYESLLEVKALYALKYYGKELEEIKTDWISELNLLITAKFDQAFKNCFVQNKSIKRLRYSYLSRYLGQRRVLFGLPVKVPPVTTNLTTQR